MSRAEGGGVPGQSQQEVSMRGDICSAWRRRLCGHLGKGSSRERKMKAEIQRRESICNQQGDWSRGHWARGGGGRQSHWKTLQGEESHRKILHSGVSVPSQGGTVGAQAETGTLVRGHYHNLSDRWQRLDQGFGSKGNTGIFTNRHLLGLLL